MNLKKKKKKFERDATAKQVLCIFIRILKSRDKKGHMGFIFTNETSQSLQREKMNTAPYVIIGNAWWDIGLLQAKWNRRWITAFLMNIFSVSKR